MGPVRIVLAYWLLVSISYEDDINFNTVRRVVSLTLGLSFRFFRIVECQLEFALTPQNFVPQ